MKWNRERTKKHSLICHVSSWIKIKAKAYNTRYSQEVSHPSTDHGPDAAWLRCSDENLYIQRGMVVAESFVIGTVFVKATAHFTTLARSDHRLRMWISRVRINRTHRFISYPKSVVASGKSCVVCGKWLQHERAAFNDGVGVEEWQVHVRARSFMNFAPAIGSEWKYKQTFK